MNHRKPIAVFGLGLSNLSLIKALSAQGAELIAWDDNEAARDKAASFGAQIKTLTPGTLKKCEVLVLAPGVPLHHPAPHDVVIAANEAGIEVICDIEMRYRLERVDIQREMSRKSSLSRTGSVSVSVRDDTCEPEAQEGLVYRPFIDGGGHALGWDCQTIGITGTNGKSTTTALIGHILKENDIQSAIGGNIGVPIFDLDIPPKNGVLVLELSSFQLDLCPSFKPDISILLNLTPDHLDRHGTMDEYAAAKYRMFEGQGSAVIVGDDEYCQMLKAKTTRQLLTVPEITQDYPTLRGQHNRQNMQAAFAVCSELGLSANQITQGFQTFPGLPHRQFLVRTLGQTEYINDSKATNAQATSKALSSFDNIIWIVGGLAKDGGLSGLEPFMPKIKKALIIGQAPDIFTPFFEQHTVPYENCETMNRAVDVAHGLAQEMPEKTTVLLSPATASFDQYKNFEKRGEHFQTLVNGLPE